MLKLWRDELFAVSVIVFRVNLHRRDGRTHAASLHAVFKLTSKDHNIIIDFPLYPNCLFVFTVLLPVAIQYVTKHHYTRLPRSELIMYVHENVHLCKLLCLYTRECHRLILQIGILVNMKVITKH